MQHFWLRSLARNSSAWRAATTLLLYDGEDMVLSPDEGASIPEWPTVNGIEMEPRRRRWRLLGVKGQGTAWSGGGPDHTPAR